MVGFAALLVLVACGSEPETVVETIVETVVVENEVVVEKEVTVVVEQEVVVEKEVTVEVERDVEVTVAPEE